MASSSSGSSSVMRKTLTGSICDEDENNLKVVRRLANMEENRHCFDCGQPGPTYVNMTIGAYVCTACSGRLRGLIPPHRVKSITMAKFSRDELEFMKARGNELSRQVWLARLDSSAILSSEDKDKLSSHLTDKYERRRWYVAPSETLHEQARGRASLALEGLRVGGGVRGSVTMPDICLQMSPLGAALPLSPKDEASVVKRPSIIRRHANVTSPGVNINNPNWSKSPDSGFGVAPFSPTQPGASPQPWTGFNNEVKTVPIPRTTSVFGLAPFNSAGRGGVIPSHTGTVPTNTGSYVMRPAQLGSVPNVEAAIVQPGAVRAVPGQHFTGTVPAGQSAHFSGTVPAHQQAHFSGSLSASQQAHFVGNVPAMQSSHYPGAVPALPPSYQSTVGAAPALPPSYQSSVGAVPAENRRESEAWITQSLQASNRQQENFANFADFSSPQADPKSPPVVLSPWGAPRSLNLLTGPVGVSEERVERTDVPPVPEDKYAALIEGEEKTEPPVVDWTGATSSPDEPSSTTSSNRIHTSTATAVQPVLSGVNQSSVIPHSKVSTSLNQIKQPTCNPVSSGLNQLHNNGVYPYSASNPDQFPVSFTSNQPVIAGHNQFVAYPSNEQPVSTSFVAYQDGFRIGGIPQAGNHTAAMSHSGVVSSAVIGYQAQPIKNDVTSDEWRDSAMARYDQKLNPFAVDMMKPGNPFL